MNPCKRIVTIKLSIDLAVSIGRPYLFDKAMELYILLVQDFEEGVSRVLYYKHEPP